MLLLFGVDGGGTSPGLKLYPRLFHLYGLHRNRFARALWLLLLLANIAASYSCRFPPKWSGTWFQKGVQPPIKIEGENFSIKGVCLEYSGDMFLIEDTREKCYRCVVIYEKHPNVLQYRETYCDEYRTLEQACARLNVDAHLYSMFRVDARPVSCPFKGPFTFTYTRGHGECKNPVSTVDTCTDDSHLLFRFQACADVLGTESSVEELTCLATWKEGSAHYLVGKMRPQKNYAVLHDDEHNYRCFVYDHLSDKGGYKVSQSADATCDGLVSTWEGSRIMKLTKSKHPTVGCQFPAWVMSTHRWHTLDGRVTYSFSHKNTSFRISHSHADHPDTKVTCTEEVSTSPNSTTVVAYSMQGCSNGFVCLAFVQRERHIVEIQIGEFARRPQDACLLPLYDSTSMEYVTLVTPSPATYNCPQLVDTDGLRIQAGKLHLESEICPDTTAVVVGCRSQETLEFLTTCAATREHMAFQCQGMWEENGRNYLIAGLKGTKAKFCFVYYSNTKVTHFSGLLDTCNRTVVPGVTGNLTFNITSAGECDNPLNKGTGRQGPHQVLVVALLSLPVYFVR